MKNRLPLSALLAAPLLLALAPSAADLSFHPADDTSVSRTYAIDLEFELGDLSAVVDGQDISEMVPADFDISAEMVLKITHHFVRSAGGRPLELVRSYEEMSGEAVAMGESQDMEGFDELEGKSVRFEWNEDEEDYDVSFHESEGDADALEGLTPDMDLRALLPGRDVEPGDVWTVEASQLESVFLFGNKLEGSGEEEMDQLIETELRPQLERMLEDFSTTCEYKGERDEDGRSVGVVALKMHGDGVVDLAPLIMAGIEASAGELPIELDIDTAELELTFDSEGEALWDLAGGHLHGFEMQGEVELMVVIAISADADGESHSMDADAEIVGSGTWKVTPAGE